MSKLSKSLGLFTGVFLSYTVSEPNLTVNNSLPEKTFKNILFIPKLEIKHKNCYYHIHHWLYFSIVYSVLITYRGNFTGKKFINGLILGIIFQGLTYNDRFKIKERARIKVVKS